MRLNLVVPSPSVPMGNQSTLGGATAADPAVTQDLHLNYAPTVNPIAVGGYFWVVFTSPRDYGNRMVAAGSPVDPTYDNNKQLWVSAIDANVGGTASCTAGFECCSGYCQNGSCSMQTTGCSNLGDKCTSTSQCCTTSGSNIACIGGFCEPQQPQ